MVFTSSGVNGWIYRGKVSNNPPDMQRDPEDEDFFLVEYSESNIDGEEMQTARSIRGGPSNNVTKESGLSDVAKAYAQITEMPEKYQKALFELLCIQTNDDEVETFLKTFKIGEYAD